jgi:hypothetical protein
MNDHFTADEVVTFVQEWLRIIIEESDRKLSKRSDVQKAVVDVVSKSMGSIAADVSKHLITGGAEVLVPVGGAAIEQLSKAFLASLIKITDGTNKALRTLIDRPLRAGVEWAFIGLNTPANTAAEESVRSRQIYDSIKEFSRAAQSTSDVGILLAIRMMQALLSLKLNDISLAKQYLSFCTGTMEKRRSNAIAVRDEFRRSAQHWQRELEWTVKMLKEAPHRVTLDWPGRDGDEYLLPISAEDYNRENQGLDNPVAIRDPETLNRWMNEDAARWKKEDRLIRVLDFFLQLQATNPAANL